MRLERSIVADNTAPSRRDIFANSGTLTATGPLAGTAAFPLAPLDDYGGLTLTMALQPGSPARDAAPGSTLLTDQRGFPLVGTRDLGAYEVGTLTSFTNFIWETLTATATAAQHAATFDFDGDGANNHDEWLAGPWTLSDTNTYTGPTTIAQGTLSLAHGRSLSPDAALRISTGAMVALDFKGQMNIRQLTLDGKIQPAGDYSAASAPGFIKGTGVLRTQP